MSAIIETEITHKYLMNKTKEDMASLTMWIVKLRNKESIELAQLKLDLDAAHAFADIDRQRLKEAYAERDALKKERDELRVMLDGADIAGPELMAENEKLRHENSSAYEAIEAILKFEDCNYGPAWNMQKIARATLIQAHRC